MDYPFKIAPEPSTIIAIRSSSGLNMTVINKESEERLGFIEKIDGQYMFHAEDPDAGIQLFTAKDMREIFYILHVLNR